MQFCGSASFKYTLLLPLPIPVSVIGPFIVLFFTLGQTDLQLGIAFFPVHRGGDQGVALAFYQADQFVQLPSVQQQFPGAGGISGDVGGGGAEGDDMGAKQIGLPILDGDVALLDLGASLAQTLDLPTLQGDAGLITFFDEEVVPGLFIQGNGGAG